MITNFNIFDKGKKPKNKDYVAVQFDNSPRNNFPVEVKNLIEGNIGQIESVSPRDYLKYQIIVRNMTMSYLLPLCKATLL